MQRLEMVDEKGRHMCTFHAVKGIDIRQCPRAILVHSLHGRLLSETVDAKGNIKWVVERGKDI